MIPSIITVDTSLPTAIGSKIAPQVIILADTRPLIQQITKIAKLIAETVYDDIKIAGYFSGYSHQETHKSGL